MLLVLDFKLPIHPPPLVGVLDPTAMTTPKIYTNIGTIEPPPHRTLPDSTQPHNTITTSLHDVFLRIDLHPMEQGEGTSVSRNAGAYVLLRFLMQAHEVKGFG